MADSPNRPSIPPYIRSEDVVAIVSITPPSSSIHLHDSAFIRTNIVRQGNIAVGVQVFLLLNEHKFDYVFGRQSTTATNAKSPDVHLPSSSVGVQQFKMVPDWGTNLWRVHSMSETKCTVNGVPLQKPARSRRSKDTLPQMLYLDRSHSTHVTVRDVQMDIWLMKTPREIVTSTNYRADPVDLTLQDVRTRNEGWAQLQYVSGYQQLSNRSSAVRHKFTGTSFAAKAFPDDAPRRDEEFVMFNMSQVDASVVSYRQSTSIHDVPVIITDLYEGFQSYASLRTTMKQWHPSLRFRAAFKLLRRLFAALEFLNFNGIVHGNMSHDSVLIRVVDYEVVEVLLVDYSHAYRFPLSNTAPKEAMIADGKAVIQLIDDLCELWTMRMAPTPTARSEAVMQKRTQEARKRQATIERCFRDYTDHQGHSKSSEKGKSLKELLDLANMDLRRAQNNQIHNSKLKEVGYVTKPALDDLQKNYIKDRATPTLGPSIPWNLSLGHPYLDGIITRLYHEQWDLTPRDICRKIKEIAGPDENPWQTINVTLTFSFEQPAQSSDPRRGELPASGNFVALAIEPVLSWLAVCCEVCPEWLQAIRTEFAKAMHSIQLGVSRKMLHDFYRALGEHGKLPSSLHQVFEYLLNLYDKPSQDTYAVDIDYKIWFHRPSKMVNVTQLQRLASPENLLSCVAENKVNCNHFAEVRGSRELEGCYVPMVVLPELIDALGLLVRDLPDVSLGIPTFDPSDFSQAPHQGRVVLARQGLLAYASILRSRDQCCWYDLPKSVTEVETPSQFLPTYFGDVEIFPKVKHGSYHPQPEHWARFVTADAPGQQHPGPARHVITMGSTQSLSNLLRQRKNIRDGVFRKRKLDEIDREEPATRRVQTEITASPHITVPVQGQAVNRLKDPKVARQNNRSPRSKPSSIPRRMSADTGQHYDTSFTIASESPVGEGDWDKVEQWLEEEANKESSQPLFGFQVNCDAEGSETERDQSISPSRLPKVQEGTSSSIFGRVRGNDTTPKHNVPARSLFESGGGRSSETTPQQNFPAMSLFRSPTNIEGSLLEVTMTTKRTPKPQQPQNTITPRQVDDTIGGFSRLSFEDDTTSPPVTTTGQSGPSQAALNISFYSSPASALGTQPYRGLGAVQESFPDTDAGNITPREKAGDADDTPF
ncbi:hypothetical protein B5807_10456 [Epicoccum nigrum]|uniref:Protein kinase domain-containing protein n=1 Tax=Epicoccum nigrum TaxID=105696 RepID=A0A1Y2LL29_EPING|nr:hypothetical protein B5807_10456 [Epicoccum nigrum]